MSQDGRKKARRSYAPAVEALEALRLLDRGAAPFLPTWPAEQDTLPTTPAPAAAPPSPTPHDTWDAALGQARLDDLLRSAPDPKDSQAGLDQLNRYLSRAWFRAGIAPSQHEDCTQAVYVTLLQNMGRPEFDALTAEIGQQGIRQVLSRDTEFGPDFFRAIDKVKKQSLRQKSYQALDDNADVAGNGGESDRWRGALQEAIARSLSPREAALVQDTLMGKTPAEIASQWGVAPKTVSNEKTRAIQKLREALVADMAD